MSSGTSSKGSGVSGKLWGGRFSSGPSACMHAFNQSLSFDQRLASADVQGSKAYAAAIHSARLITAQELDDIQRGLGLIEQEWANGTFVEHVDDEDIHSANERRLQELIGDAALKLHTGRSRNDQVATDLRLWLMSACETVSANLKAVLSAMLKRAEEHIDVLMPGYTHLQRAQPIRFSHWLLSHAWPLQRDLKRLRDCVGRVRVCPLGSGALAGNPFGVDRTALATALGFDSCTPNSLDAVSDRDHVTEFIFVCTLIQTHLSRLAEDLIVYATSEFAFVSISDSFSTGSSLMPQKRNPDALELLRGKAGRVLGSLTTLLVSMKGTPSSYNKDFQEDKEPLFDAFDTVSMSLQIALGVVDTLTLNSERMSAALSVSMLSTDIAYYLVKRGVPFRRAHHLSGEVVALAERVDKQLSELSLDELKSVSELFEADVESVWQFESSVDQYQVEGGTGRNAVQMQTQKLKEWLDTN